MGENEGKAHVVMLCFPGYGHICPMIQFARRSACKGIKVTFATSLSAINSIQSGSNLISLLSTYDDITKCGSMGPGRFVGFLERFQNNTTKILIDMIEKSLEEADERRKVKCLVYDSGLQWALDTAKEFLGSTASYYLLNLKVHGQKLEVPVLDILDFSITRTSP